MTNKKGSKYILGTGMVNTTSRLSILMIASAAICCVAAFDVSGTVARLFVLTFGF
jgi:hypothetical protein